MYVYTKESITHLAVVVWCEGEDWAVVRDGWVSEQPDGAVAVTRRHQALAR